MSKVISQLIWSCITTLCNWLKNSRHFVNQSAVKLKPKKLSYMRFPALGAGDLYLLRDLIGSFYCLLLFQMARVIISILVLRHSIENRSNALGSLAACSINHTTEERIKVRYIKCLFVPVTSSIFFVSL